MLRCSWLRIDEREVSDLNHLHVYDFLMEMQDLMSDAALTAHDSADEAFLLSDEFVLYLFSQVLIELCSITGFLTLFL